MERIKRYRPSRRADERGATFIFTAICMVVLLWAGAMGVDVGFTVYGSRQAQAIADTTALDLSRDIQYADTLLTNPAISAYLKQKLAYVKTDNGSNANITVVPGLWMNGKFTQANKCAPTNPPAVYPCNALMVTAAQAVPQIFKGGFNSPTARSSSIAADTPLAGFSIGTYLANYNSQQTAVLNDVLGGLGTQVNLTAVGYEGLASTYVTIAQLIAASGGLLTTSNVMTASLPGTEWQQIWENAVGSGSVNGYINALGFSSVSAKLCQLVSVNGSTCSNGSLSTPALQASVNVLQELTTEAELANGANALDVTSALNLGVPGLTISKVTLSLDLIQPPQVAYGPTGTTASSAQVSEDLQISAPLVGTIDVPLSAADGTSTLNTITCSADSMTSTKINSTTTAATASVTLTPTGQPVGGGTTTNIASMSVGGVSGVSGATSYSGSVVPPTATTESGNTNPKAIGTTSPSFTVTMLGVQNPLVSTLLGSVLPGALGPVLQAAGVTLAGADVADLSTNCDAISIVQ